MYVTKFVVFEKSEKTVVWNTYNLHEFKFSASDSKICVRYDNLKFKQLLSLFWNHFGTIWPCFSYWFLVSFWGYFHIKGYYQLTNTSSDLTPFFLGFKLKELAEIRQFEPKNSHSSDTKVAWNPYEVRVVETHKKWAEILLVNAHQKVPLSVYLPNHGASMSVIIRNFTSGGQKSQKP